MRKCQRHSTALAFALGVLLSGAPLAFAEETVCTGTLGPVTLDNVIVPERRSCTLNGTRLNGTLKVSTGATVSVSGVRINGNIQAEGARGLRESRLDRGRQHSNQAGGQRPA